MGGQQISKPIGKPKVGGSNLGVTKKIGIRLRGLGSRVWSTGCGQQGVVCRVG